MGQYSFADTTPNQLETDSKAITEGLVFGNYHSIKQGWWLVERDAPSPAEKMITETVPYTQGVLDFSMLSNDRYFENREVSYQLKKVNQDYCNRKIVENELKKQLMPLGIQKIKDTHDGNLHWLGKCKSVEVEDDAKNRDLTATITFDCYPFAISDEPEGNDIWDDVFFDDWLFQDINYQVNGNKSITLYNIGACTVDVELIVTGDITISNEVVKLALKTGSYKNTEFVLQQGENKITLTGNGTIEFRFYKEVMI